jgi:hypothetical protein
MHMAGLTGESTERVGRDIVNYLDEVARFFGVTIRVTSGYRNPDGQALAMFKNWSKLTKGPSYRSTLSPADRSKLDEYRKTATSHAASATDRLQAKHDFLKLAKARIGAKSMHTRGRAVDVDREHIDSRIYRAITARLHEVKEGRTDIYHFESAHLVPPVDAAVKAQWQAIKNGSAGIHPRSISHGHGCWC